MVTHLLVDETSLYPDRLVVMQKVDHDRELLECLVEIVDLLQHDGGMEATFLEVLVFVEGLVVALDGLLHDGEDLELDAAQLVVGCVCNQLLLLGIFLGQCLL